MGQTGRLRLRYRTLPCVKQIVSVEPAIRHRQLGPVLSDDLDGWDGVGVGEGGLEEEKAHG